MFEEFDSSSWIISVELAIGPEEGISYLTDKGANPTHLADFNQVQTIQYSNSEDKDRKGMLQLKIAGAPEVRYDLYWLWISWEGLEIVILLMKIFSVL
ncbi:hypothetical protein AV530_009523 [Patagioenas fasciata monilis]|uniref:FAK1-like FERM domain-containing protein n=1 Tax=Patagioenas fasciata monilis TaxID=372326 RepID=A0A1V4KN52_PATFA|nr:hypothetical protein AV530_009523 [Patagioenas fasciata monilis]